MIRSVPSIPPMPGISMSITTTSGRSRGSDRTASSAVPASPTGSRPSSRSSSSRRPLRSTAWSSTSRMRTGSLTGPPGRRQPRCRPRGRTRSAGPRRAARRARGSRPGRGARSAPRGRSRAPSSSTTRRTRDPRAVATMLTLVASLCRTTLVSASCTTRKRATWTRLGQLGVEAAQVHVDLHASGRPHALGLLLDRRREPALPQRGRPQAGGQLPQRRRRGGHLAAQLGDPLAERPLGDVALEGPQVHRDRGQRLPGLVVELAGEPGPLGLLGLDRAPHALAGRPLARRGGLAPGVLLDLPQLLPDRAGVGEGQRDVAREGREQAPGVVVEGPRPHRNKGPDDLVVQLERAGLDRRRPQAPLQPGPHARRPPEGRGCPPRRGPGRRGRTGRRARRRRRPGRRRRPSRRRSGGGRAAPPAGGARRGRAWSSTARATSWTLSSSSARRRSASRRRTFSTATAACDARVRAICSSSAVNGPPQLVRQVEVAEDLAAEADRHAQERLHLRVVRGEAHRAGVVRDPLEAQRPRVPDQRAEQAAAPRQLADRRRARASSRPAVTNSASIVRSASRTPSAA